VRPWPRAVGRACAGGLLVLELAALGCRPALQGRRYPIRGQVIAVHAERGELLLRHQDIPGFMPAMVMPFPVAEPRRLDGLRPGDLVEGLLVVGETSASLERLKRTGFRALPPEATRAVSPAGQLAPGEAVPDVRLVDSQGRDRRLAEWRGRALALTFIFTRCPLPEFCPAMDRRFGELQALLRADAALRSSARLLSVSFDPAHDTAQVLRQHARRLGADPELWVFATGESAEIDAFGAAFGLSVVRAPEISHNLRTAVIDPAGRLAALHSGADWTAAELYRELRQAAAKP
jgi:protein SCO1